MIAEQYESMSREAPQECTIQMQMVHAETLSFCNRLSDLDEKIIG